MNTPLLYDVTLRDGSHANQHGFTSDFCSTYIDNAYSAGIRYLEIGHGNGLGGSSLHIGRLKDPDLWQAVSDKACLYDDLRIGVHVIPGLATFADLDIAVEKGVQVFRMACHCTEADTTETYIEYAAQRGQEVWGLLMMAHMIRPDHLAREAKKMESYGASRIVFLDSAGALTPSLVRNITEELKSVVEVPIGFHAHNNLHAAVANSLAALAAGCDSIDACARGYGAGAGNLSLEAFVALLEKDGRPTGLDVRKLTDLAALIEVNHPSTLPKVDSLSTATGFHGVFSGFKPKIVDAANAFSVNPMDIIAALGKAQVIAGQEDQIIATASQLANTEHQP
ncbi:MAG: 4-hydroxy-2-oxovalerate aldolase [Cyanobacteriota bacterium]